MKRLLLPAVIALSLITIYASFRSKDAFFPRLGGLPVSPGKLESVLEGAERALSKNPRDFKAQVDKGVAYYMMGSDHYGDALNALSAARAEGAFDERIFYYLGLLYENLSVFDEAEKQYTRFLNHEPGDREIRLRLARLDFRMGKWKESIEQYQHLTQKNPKDVTSLTNIGLAYQLRYKSESAIIGKNKKTPAELNSYVDAGIAHLERAREQDANLSKGVYLALAQMYGFKGLWEKSAEAAKEEITRYPQNVDIETYRTLAQAYEKLDRKENLLETYQAWTAADPKNQIVPRKIRLLKKQLKIK